MQLFATRGICGSRPDAPIQMQLADQMRALADVLLPAVDKAIALGIADSDRVGVMGHSWGGYTVLALLVQTHRFRAAVMRGGYGDLFDRYGDMDPSGSTFGQLQLESWLGATPWRDLPRYIDQFACLLPGSGTHAFAHCGGRGRRHGTASQRVTDLC